MKIDITSMFFNSKIEGQTATPAWGTSIGQNKSRDCRIDDFKPEVVDMVIGMTYRSVSDLDKLDVSKGSSGREIIMCSVFDNVFINNEKLDKAQYTLLLVREHSKRHDGRLIVSYAPYINYNGRTNQECINQMREAIGCSAEGCWFVYDITIKNQSNLYFNAVVVNATTPMVYNNNTKSKNRSEEWRALIPSNENTRLFSGKCLQQIFYGAPGTGKSHEIKEQTEGKAVVRTTFHPDSDYSTFVGAYKPTTTNEVRYGLNGANTVALKYPEGAHVGEIIKDNKITYRFVKQAFLKAYLGAWKKYSNKQTRTSLRLEYTFKIKKNEYTIKGVDDDGILIHRVFPYDISNKSITKAWNDIWSSGSFIMPTGGSGTSVQQAIATWIHKNVHNCTSQSLDVGLESLKDNIAKSGKVTINKEGINCQTYVLSKRENNYIIDVDSTCSKAKIKDYYTGKNPESGSKELQNYFSKLLQEIDSSEFNKAWDRLADAIQGNKNEIELQRKESFVEPQFLIIEEINRGNCAQIFGDLFQLLDRDDNGFSEYPIEADTDLQREIENAFMNEKDYQLEDDIDVDDAIENYTSNYEHEDGSRCSLSEDIQAGRILLLPNNLYIWATMNTSDQSLFPIDSAFKRRWDWKYMKIKKGKDEDDNELDWRIVVKDKDGNIVKINDKESLSWWDFISKINEIIASMTSSADKQLGYFFCKADNEGIINANTFVSKVIFYLWNDVFKDSGFEDASLFQYKVQEEGKEETKDLTFPDFFDEAGETVNDVRLKGFLESVMNWKKKKEEQS